MVERLNGKLIVGFTGATSTIFGVRLLQILIANGVDDNLMTRVRS